MEVLDLLLTLRDMDLLAAENKSENKRDCLFSHLQRFDSFVTLCWALKKFPVKTIAAPAALFLCKPVLYSFSCPWVSSVTVAVASSVFCTPGCRTQTTLFHLYDEQIHLFGCLAREYYSVSRQFIASEQTVNFWTCEWVSGQIPCLILYLLIKEGDFFIEKKKFIETHLGV